MPAAFGVIMSNFCSSKGFLERRRFLLTFLREVLYFLSDVFIMIPPGVLGVCQEDVGSDAHIPAKSVKEYLGESDIENFP